MSDAVRPISFVSAAKGRGVVRGTFTPIRSTERPTFVPHRMVDLPQGLEISILVEELRRKLIAFEPEVFRWLGASPGNPQEYSQDPEACLKQIGLGLDQETRGKLERLGKLIRQSSQAAKDVEG